MVASATCPPRSAKRRISVTSRHPDWPPQYGRQTAGALLHRRHDGYGRSLRSLREKTKWNKALVVNWTLTGES